MIDQVLEAKEYLAGKNISLDNVYRMCYLIAKHFLASGKGPLEVRDGIFDWANRYGIFIEHSVNSIIEKAMTDGVALRGASTVWVGKDDVAEIVRRFDGKIVRCVALAMLCYSKAFANRSGEFSIPYRALSAWVGNSSPTWHRHAVKELITFGYLEVVDRKSHVKRWNKKNLSDGSIYRIVVPVSGSKDYALKGNDIWKLYATIFDNK